jgi:hypothetical protein
VDFSEVRDLFVNIFQILGPNYKFLDCGLILEKLRGLNSKVNILATFHLSPCLFPQLIRSPQISKKTPGFQKYFQI